MRARPPNWRLQLTGTAAELIFNERALIRRRSDPTDRRQTYHARPLRPTVNNVLFSFVLSPAARAAAYLLAEALLLLLRALVAKSPHLPAETLIALQRSLETLAHQLQHIARTGDAPTEPTPRPAAATTPSRAPRYRPVSRAIPRRHLTPGRRPAHAVMRQRNTPRPGQSTHAPFVTIT